MGEDAEIAALRPDKDAEIAARRQEMSAEKDALCATVDADVAELRERLSERLEVRPVRIRRGQEAQPRARPRPSTSRVAKDVQRNRSVCEELAHTRPKMTCHRSPLERGANCFLERKFNQSVPEQE